MKKMIVLFGVFILLLAFGAARLSLAQSTEAAESNEQTKMTENLQNSSAVTSNATTDSTTTLNDPTTSSIASENTEDSRLESTQASLSPVDPAAVTSTVENSSIKNSVMPNGSATDSSFNEAATDSTSSSVIKSNLSSQTPAAGTFSSSADLELLGEGDSINAAQYSVDDPYPVSTAQQLASAINNRVPAVKFLNDIDLGNNGIAIKNDVTIDGDGHHFFYSGGANLNAGLHLEADGITIHFKNLSIGDPSKSRSANNYYGIAPTADTIENAKIIVENVNYYSDYGAQPFFIRDRKNEIIFRGNNNFTIAQRPGSVNVQEFAEATNLTFDEGSNTTVNQDKSGVYGFVWSALGPLNLTVKKNAKVNLTIGNYLIYDAIPAATILIGENAALNVTTTDPTLGRLINNATATLNLEVATEGHVNINTAQASYFNRGSLITLASGATGIFTTTANTFFTGVVAGNIVVDNAQELTFAAKETNPTGFDGGNFILKPFSSDTTGYDIKADNQLLENQAQLSDWTINNNRYQRSPVSFSTQVAARLSQAKMISLIRTRPAPIEKFQIVSVPNFDFGESTVTGQVQVLRPKWDQPLRIEDTRSDPQKRAYLYLKIVEPLHNGEMVLNSLSYVNADGVEQALSSQATLVEQPHIVTAQNISDTWNQAMGPDARGLELTIPIEKQKVGQYTGKLEWSLQDVPENN